MGIEKTLLFKSIALRLGGVKADGEDLVLTGGLGLKLGPALVDLAVINSNKPGYYATVGIKF